jgi:putative ABC transport system substrate-binding protein
VKRREFISLIAGTAVVLPLTTRAQQPAIPVIGLLSARSSVSGALMATAFRQGLSEAGYIEDQNVRIEYRWAEGQYHHLPELADDLVRLRVRVKCGQR